MRAKAELKHLFDSWPQAEDVVQNDCYPIPLKSSLTMSTIACIERSYVRVSVGRVTVQMAYTINEKVTGQAEIEPALGALTERYLTSWLLPI